MDGCFIHAHYPERPVEEGSCILDEKISYVPVAKTVFIRFFLLEALISEESSWNG